MSASTKPARSNHPLIRILSLPFDRQAPIASTAATARLSAVLGVAVGTLFGGCGSVADRPSVPSPPTTSALAPASASASAAIASPAAVPSTVPSSSPASPLPARIVAHRRDAAGPVVELSNGDNIPASCAVMRTGEVRCWGRLVEAKGKPFVLATSATALPEAHDVTLASGAWMFVDRAGKARCPWGCPSDHRLEMSDIVQLTRHCALTATGAIGCQSDAYATKFRRPAIRIAQGEHHLCAVIEDGTVECFGSNGYGQVAPRSSAAQADPDRPSAATDDVVVVPGVRDVVDIAAGSEHTCALQKEGTVLCWGSGYQGNLGDGAQGKMRGPVAVKGLVDAISLVAVPFGWSTCAIRRNARLVCWGATSAWMDRAALEAGPVEVPGAKDVVAALVDGDLCYATKRGEVRCAGVLATTDDRKELLYGKTAKDMRVVLPASE
jgi:alpha-tubulin suppressor-like RCC1 family protein